MADGATEGVGQGLRRILDKPGFEPEKFVNKQSQGEGGKDALLEVRGSVQTLAENTAVELKKNVYKNYSQFIETAKEISILEGEMYQLSHMLTDQKSIMTTMMEMSITSDKGLAFTTEGPTEPEQPTQEDDMQKNLAFLLEKVEGCSNVTEVPGRYLVHDDDLFELDPESFLQVQKVHAFLLSDSLMIATWLPHRRGPVKYRFQSLYELDNLAVVNARDVGQCKNAFKILMFPDTRMYQAENPKAKRQWLDILEETKKKKAAADTQRKEAERLSTRFSTVSRVSTFSLDSNNPFAEEEEEPEVMTPMLTETDMLHADWLQELPEDLDVCIAQRDFEGAVDLVEKVNEFLQGCPKSAAVKEYRARIDHRIKQLTEVLMHELQVSPERSLRGGPRAARRAVTQLVRMGRSAQACDLFLNNRSAIIKYNLRQLKIEGATTLYIKRVCAVFFTSIHETGKEFIKAFPQHYGCYSAFVVWAKSELKGFVDMLCKQVFGSKATLATVTESVAEARKYCDQLIEIGLELTFAFNNLLIPELEKVTQANRELQLDAVKHRASEDLWRPVNWQNKEGSEKFEEEMFDLGILSIHDYTYDECFTYLTANTIHFTKAYLTFCDDILKVYCQELHQSITLALSDVLYAQLKHVDKSLQSREFAREKRTIQQNGAFLLLSLLPLVHGKVEDATGQVCKQLLGLRSTFRKFKDIPKEKVEEFV